MIIKKFQGKTEAEAIETAKKELGSGVVIMNVKNVKPKGLAALFRPKYVEVTVALEEEKEIGAANARFDSANLLDTQAKTNVKVTNTDNIEKKLDSLQTLLENRLSKEELTHSEEEEAPKREAAAPAVAPKENASKKAEETEEKEPENKEQEKFIRLLYNTMIDNEVDEKYANQLLDDMEKSKKPNIPFDYILANIYQKMILKFGNSEGIVPAEKNPKVVVFIGPTGVGKTTTIAKLASRFAVETKKKVALLTADTYRIAAAEQLRTYANILEVPFRVIYTKEELQTAIQNFEEYDYIFVDTAGHSHQNEQQLGDMKVLLNSLQEMEHIEYQCFLVLSASTKYRDLLTISERYKAIADYQFIFTKLDETSTLGNLLNLKLAANASIAYVTCGQNVPDDIEQFSPQKTVKQLLGGKH